MAKLEGEIAWERQPTTEERIAALEAQSAGQTKVISELLSGLISANQRLEALEADLAQIKTGLQEGLLSVCHRLEALEAKPKGNRQGYPSAGVVWDGQVRLMAKAYGYTSAEIDDMQEAMDTYFLALVGTSKARVSSNWQLNARTWIKLDAKRHGRERQDGPGSSEDGTRPKDKPDLPTLGVAALRAILPGIADDQLLALYGACKLVPAQINSCAAQLGMDWQITRDAIENRAAKLGITAGAFAWPAV